MELLNSEFNEYATMKLVDIIGRLSNITQKLSLHLLANHLANDSSTLTDLCVLLLFVISNLKAVSSLPDKIYSKHALTHFHSVNSSLRWQIYCTVYILCFRAFFASASHYHRHHHHRPLESDASLFLFESVLCTVIELF